VLQEVEAPRTSRQSAHKNVKAASPTHRPPLPSRKYPWYLANRAARKIKSTKNKLRRQDELAGQLYCPGVEQTGGRLM